MDKLFEIDVDTTALIAALRQVGVEVERELRAEASHTAQLIAKEAQSRLERQLGPEATGKTVRGIKVIELTHEAVVIAERNPYPILPYWLEKGTEHMRARPFFDASVRLEEGGFLRRVETIVQGVIDRSGLGV